MRQAACLLVLWVLGLTGGLMITSERVHVVSAGGCGRYEIARLP